MYIYLYIYIYIYYIYIIYIYCTYIYTLYIIYAYIPNNELSLDIFMKLVQSMGSQQIGHSSNPPPPSPVYQGRH